MENWIKKAFDKASEDAEEHKKLQEITEDWLENCSSDLLDDWCKTVPKHVVNKIYKIMQDEELSEAFYSMCASFFMSGLATGVKMSEDDE